MPIYLRKFYSKKLLKVKKEEQKQMDKATKKSPKPNIPKFPQR
jgi:hypothetical protein